MKITVTGTRGIPNIQGGVETHCEELFPRLVEKGFDITLIRRDNYTFDDLKIFKGVKLVNIKNPKQKSFEAIIHTFKAVWFARFKLKTTILHIHAIGPAIVTPFARLLGLKVVFTHHGADYEREKWGKAAKLILKFGEYLGVKYANEVIVISEVINDQIQQKYNRNDAHLIFNGVNIPDKGKDLDFIKSLGLEKGKYIFAMGRFVPEKGFDMLIQVYSEMKLNGIQLVIAGDADHEDEYSLKLKNLALKHNIILTGFIKGEKLNELLTNASLFILPSYHEGLPIALLEAMSYNLDVLVSDIPANKAVNLDDSCYFKNKNQEDLAKKITMKLLNSKFNVEYDLSPYDWDEISTKTSEVYLNLAPKIT